MIKDFFRGRARFFLKNTNNSVYILNKLRVYCVDDVQLNARNMSFYVPLIHKSTVARILRNEKFTYKTNLNIFNILNFFYMRVALSVTAILCLVALIISNYFVFRVEVHGADAAHTMQIFEYLNSQNMKALTPKSDKSTQVTAQAITEHFDFVAHTSGKIVGSTLVFSVYEVKVADDKNNNNDIVSTADSVIKSIIVASGRAVVSVGDIVRKGDVLIKGEYKISETETRACRAVGEVIAEVKYAMSVVLFDECQTMTRTGASETRTAIYCPQFYPGGVQNILQFQNYEIDETTECFTLFLRFCIVKTTYYETRLTSRKVNLETHKHVVAGQLLEKISVDSGITQFDQVDYFFNPLTPNSICVEVVATINQIVSK